MATIFFVAKEEYLDNTHYNFGCIKMTATHLFMRTTCVCGWAGVHAHVQIWAYMRMQAGAGLGADILSAQWADASDEVDLGELFLGISMDDDGAQ